MVDVDPFGEEILEMIVVLGETADIRLESAVSTSTVYT